MREPLTGITNERNNTKIINMSGKRCNPSGRMTMIKLLLGAAAATGLLGGSSNNVVLAQTTSGSSSLSSNPDGCVADYDAAAGVDYFPDKAIIEYAETFTVDYLPTYKVLTVSDGFSETVYVLYQCGTPVPDLDDNTTVVQQYISIPVTNVSTGTTDHVPRIEVQSLGVSWSRMGTSVSLHPARALISWQD